MAAAARDAWRTLADEVRRRTDLAELIGRTVRLRPAGRREFLGLCPFHTERTASFTVAAGKGFFHCFGCGAHGDAIGWLLQWQHWSFAEALAWLAAAAGLAVPDHLAAAAGGAPARRRHTTADGRAPEVCAPDPQAARDARARGIAEAREIWASGRPVAGTLAERYLRSRGITVPAPPSLRFVPWLAYWHRPRDGRPNRLGRFPALVCAVQAPDGRVQGVQRIYLDPDSGTKLRLPDPDDPDERLPAKKGAGEITHGALRLGPAAERIDLAEGPETGLSLLQGLGERRTIWVTCGLNNLAGGGRGRGAAHPDQSGVPDGAPPRRLPSERPDPARPGIVLPPLCRSVGLAEDADNKDPAAAECLYRRAAARFARDGRTVYRFRPPPGMDFNDWLQRLQREAAA